MIYQRRVYDMPKRVPRHRLLSSLHGCKLLLLIFWFAGLILGIAYTYRAQPFASLMRSAVSGSVSIVGLGAVLFLPYLLTVSTVCFFRSIYLIPVAFCKAFAYGVCAACVEVAFGEAGWLIRLLLLFSDTASLPVLLWLWLRCLDNNRIARKQAFLKSAGALAIIGVVDYMVIAPFLDSVL